MLHRLIVDKILFALSAATGGVSIALFVTVIDVPVGITSWSLVWCFLLIMELLKNFLKQWEKKAQ